MFLLRCTFLQQAANDSCIEEELGLVGASAEDTEAELIRRICEMELLAGESESRLVLPRPSCVILWLSLPYPTLHD